jgi:hypothetical protein
MEGTQPLFLSVFVTKDGYLLGIDGVESVIVIGIVHCPSIVLKLEAE